MSFSALLLPAETFDSIPAKIMTTFDSETGNNNNHHNVNNGDYVLENWDYIMATSAPLAALSLNEHQKDNDAGWQQEHLNDTLIFNITVFCQNVNVDAITRAFKRMLNVYFFRFLDRKPSICTAFPVWDAMPCTPKFGSFLRCVYLF